MRTVSKLVLAAMLLRSMIMATDDVWAAPALTLAVQASKAEYAAGEMPAFTMTLSLATSAPAAVAVSPIPVGNIHVLRVTRDGVRLRPVHRGVLFYEDPSVFQEAALRDLLPGESVSVPYHVFLAEDGVSPALDDVHTPTRITRGHRLLHYTLERPGAFDVQFAYDYAGPDGGRSNVFRARVPSNVVTFTLR
jgi:hypothetical protein